VVHLKSFAPIRRGEIEQDGEESRKELSRGGRRARAKLGPTEKGTLRGVESLASGKEGSLWKLKRSPGGTGAFDGILLWLSARREGFA